MVVTFNELLRVHSIDPEQVTLLRHTGQKGPFGLNPYDLWRRADGSFDLYQRTQAPGERIFDIPYWASFVSAPRNETLFVGLYRARKADPALIDWPDPMTGLPPGATKGRQSDLYDIELSPVLTEYRGVLTIEWDLGWVQWTRYAISNNFPIVGAVDIRPFRAFESSVEGAELWRLQRTRERDSGIREAVLQGNAQRHAGLNTCEACAFSHGQRRMFDVHHTLPLLAGPRSTTTGDLVVLCPTCHRRAHGGSSRMQPFTVEELREWNAAGRP